MPTTRMRLMAVAALAAAVALSVGCNTAAPLPVPDPDPGPVATTTTTIPEPTTTTTAPAPVVQPLVVGDSITWQTVMSGAFPAEWRGVTMMGWSMRTPDVQAALTSAITDGTQRIVVALGTNDAQPLPPPYGGGGADGWSQTDADTWTRLLDALPADTHVALVKPWLTASYAAGHLAEIDEARAFIDSYAAGRPNTTVVDWRTYVEAGPVLGPDGIHLDPIEPGTSIPVTAVAAQARIDAIAQGLS